MIKNKLLHSGFTLIEIVVSMAILGIIMVSILSIYAKSIDISKKSEFHRVIQENIKNSFSQIGEDIKNNSIAGVGNRDNLFGSCSLGLGSKNYIEGQKLCTLAGDIYSLGRKEGDLYIFASNIDCDNIKQQCFLLKNGKPLTNNLISVAHLSFRLSNVTGNQPKRVSMNVTARAAVNRGLKSTDVLNSKLFLQTTFSERVFK